MEVETETEMDETETAKDAGTGSRQRCAKPPSLTRLCSRLVPAMGHWLYITTTLTYLVGGSIGTTTVCLRLQLLTSPTCLSYLLARYRCQALTYTPPFCDFGNILLLSSLLSRYCPYLSQLIYPLDLLLSFLDPI